MIEIINDSSTSKQVYVDFEFTKLGDIDTMNDKYNAEVTVQVSWLENGAFEEYDKKKHWNPQIFIENMLSKSEEIVEYTAVRQESNKTLVTEKRKVKAYFYERLEIHHFPHDLQQLSVVLASKLGSKDIKLIAKSYKLGSSTIRMFTDQQKWRLLDLVDCDSYEANTKFTSLVSKVKATLAYSKEAKILFCTYASRRPGYFYANAFLLIFLITVVSLSTFSIDCKLPQNRLPSTATFLLTSISFKWAVNRSLPPVSYTTTLDLYSIICICFLCMLCGWHAIIGAFWVKPEATQIDNWLLLAFSVVLIIVHLLFAFKAYRGYLIIRKAESRMKEYQATLETSKKNNWIPSRFAHKD